MNRYSLSEFSDLKQLAEWAKTPTRLLCYIGAVKGSDGKLLPQSSTSSLEALVIFLRCYKFTTSWDGTIEQPSLADDLVAYALRAMTTSTAAQRPQASTAPASCSMFTAISASILRARRRRSIITTASMSAAAS